ncbi:MAG: hypothetical protein L3J79_12730 [Candidatus Marinimicrobia bacterium]|nr:hypothetical protein [Candidatus Neomarinimicrobiota bacterium]
MLKLTIGTLAVLLSVSLVSTTFASNRSYIELDESDYAVGMVGAATSEVTQSATLDEGWVNLIELDASDYATNDNQTVNVVVAQNTTSAPSIEGWVNLIELDASDYEDVSPGSNQSDNRVSERILCAGTQASGATQQANCG